MKDKGSILSTAQLPQSLIQSAAAAGVTLDALSFIEVNAIANAAVTDKVIALCHAPVTVVFTSVNAVSAVANIVLSADPEWNIYCIGNATRKAVQGYFESAEIKGVATDAAALAAVIADEGEEEVVFFCGDRRMDTLPEMLRSQDIEVYEMVVYKTVETPHALTREYDGILFFSPSGADSFFSLNKVTQGTVLFAIGNTTANAIKKYTTNKTLVSETASKEVLVNYAVAYFGKLEK